MVNKMNTNSLHVSQRVVTSPFGLLGTDENALSFALGYTFQQCPPFLQWFLRQIGVQGVHKTSLRKVRINLQRYRSSESGQGITDIEIHLDGHFHIIIEAKVGGAVPSIEQCCKYLHRFHETNEFKNSSHLFKRLMILLVSSTPKKTPTLLNGLSVSFGRSFYQSAFAS